MRYTIGELSRLSGVSARALRLYEAAGLLSPARDGESGYRRYDSAQADALALILLYRQTGLPLSGIRRILSAPEYDRAQALRAQRAALVEKRGELDASIALIDRTLDALKGGITMADTEKFEGLKRAAIARNEREYGAEARAKYGAATVDASAAKVSGWTAVQWDRAQELSARIGETLRRAVAQGDPAGDLAQEVCRLHREWLCLYWPEGSYTPQAHRALGRAYAEDPRFRAYYEQAAGRGAADFFARALEVFTAK